MKNNCTKSKIEEYFFLHPTQKLRVRQIEREVEVPLPSAIRYAAELEKEGILKRFTTARVTVYSADRTSKKFLLEKKLFNLKQIFSSGLIEFLVENLSNPGIIVFGSYFRGEDIENSDLDLFIETPAEKNLQLKQFESFLQRKIQLFVYKDIRLVENKELINNMLNGAVLNGFVEVFK